MSKISINTSVDDLRSSFKCTIAAYSVEDFEKAIEDEQAGQNRVTVKKLLHRAKNRRASGYHNI